MNGWLIAGGAIAWVIAAAALVVDVVDAVRFRGAQPWRREFAGVRRPAIAGLHRPRRGAIVRPS